MLATLYIVKCMDECIKLIFAVKAKIINWLAVFCSFSFLMPATCITHEGKEPLNINTQISGVSESTLTLHSYIQQHLQ